MLLFCHVSKIPVTSGKCIKKNLCFWTTQSIPFTVMWVSSMYVFQIRIKKQLFTFFYVLCLATYNSFSQFSYNFPTNTASTTASYFIYIALVQSVATEMRFRAAVKTCTVMKFKLKNFFPFLVTKLKAIYWDIISVKTDYTY